MLEQIYTLFFPLTSILDVEKVDSIKFDLSVNDCLTNETKIHKIELDQYSIALHLEEDYSAGIKKLIYTSQQHITNDFINFINSRSEKINISLDKPEHKFLKKNLKFNLSKKEKERIAKSTYLYNIIKSCFYELMIENRVFLDFPYIVISPNIYDLISDSESFRDSHLKKEIDYNGPFAYVYNNMLVTYALNICFFINKHQENNVIYLGYKTRAKDLYLLYFQNTPHIVLDCGKVKTYGIDLHYKIYETEKHKYKKIILNDS